MSMIIEFTKIKDAKAFVRALKERFDVDDCEVKADARADIRSDDRVGPNVYVPRQFPWYWTRRDKGIAVIRRKFSITSLDKKTVKTYGEGVAVARAAENKVDALAREFNGTYVGT